jgi:hypothetical protein
LAEGGSSQVVLIEMPAIVLVGAVDLATERLHQEPEGFRVSLV